MKTPTTPTSTTPTTTTRRRAIVLRPRGPPSPPSERRRARALPVRGESKTSSSSSSRPRPVRASDDDDDGRPNERFAGTEGSRSSCHVVIVSAFRRLPVLARRDLTSLPRIRPRAARPSSSRCPPQPAPSRAPRRARRRSSRDARSSRSRSFWRSPPGARTQRDLSRGRRLKRKTASRRPRPPR